MSDEPRPREWRFYVEDVVAFCDKVLTYTHELDRASFAADTMRYGAVLRNLTLIGEAATHVPADVRALATDLPWRMVVAARNRLIHGYLGVDDDTLCSIVRDDLPSLRDNLKKLLTTRP
jgi:uncharacterized protein with HEPN domain